MNKYVKEIVDSRLLWALFKEPVVKSYHVSPYVCKSCGMQENVSLLGDVMVAPLLVEQVIFNKFSLLVLASSSTTLMRIFYWKKNIGLYL